MTFDEYYTNGLEDDFKGTVKDFFFTYSKALFKKSFDSGVLEGIKKAKVKNEVYMLQRQDAFEKSLKKTMFVEMVSLLAKYENNYFELQKELIKKINKL